MSIQPVLSPVVRAILQPILDGFAGGGLNSSFIASRTSGPAPLVVQFDCSGTTSGKTGRPWQDITFAYDYGDSGAGNYTYAAVANSPKNRNVGGMIGGHVYETAGSYTASCWAYDGYTLSLKQQTITVTAQDTVFSTTNTICCSTSGTFTGAPSGSNNQTVANLAAALAFIATGKRVLLSRADAWSCVSTFNISTAVTDAVLGSYGTGTQAAITKTGAFSIISLNNSGIARFIMQDFAITGPALASSPTVNSSTGSYTNFITLHNISDTLSSSLITLQGTARTDYLGIHKCQSSALRGGAGNVGIYVVGFGMCVIDSLVDDATSAEHCVRIPWSSNSFYYGNTFQFPASTKHAFTLRSQLWGTSEFVSLPINTYSEYNVIANNKLRGDVIEINTIRSTNGGRDERFRRNCVDTNFIEGTGVNAANGFVFTGVESIARNNVSILVANNSVGISLSGNLGQIFSDMYVVSNTSYNAAVVATFVGVQLSAATGNAFVYNNLCWGPNCTSGNTKSTVTIGATLTLQGNNSDASVRTTDPLFVGPLTSINGFQLQAGSPYVSFATSFNSPSAYCDALGYDRTALQDTGAINNVNKNTTYWSLHAA